MTDFQAVMDYIKTKLDVNQNPIQFSLKNLFEHDYQAFEYFFNNFKNFQEAFEKLINEKRCDLVGKQKTTVNLIPYEKLPPYYHKDANPDCLGKIFFIKGTIIGISEPYIVRLYVFSCQNKECSQQGVLRFEQKYQDTKTCPYCNKRISNLEVLREGFIELVLMDEFNNQIICRTRNFNDKKLNLVPDRNNILGKKAEMVVMPFEKQGKNRCYFRTDIVGYKQSNFSVLTPKRKNRALEIINENKHNLMEKLTTEIAPQHYKHDDIKKVLLMACVSPVPINISLYGDAGIGKSTLALKFLDYVENSAFVTSQTTVAGALVGVDTAEGQNRLILGQIPRANNSIVLMDEVNQQPIEIQNALLHIMSEKKIIYNKIRTFNMDVNVSLIFCGNATSPNGRFDANSPFYNQISISYPFMSRCHMVIKMDSAGTLENLDEFGKYLLKKKKAETQYTKEEIQDVIILLKSQKEKKLTESAFQAILEGWKSIVKGIGTVSQDNKESILTETNRMAGNLKSLAIAHSMFHQENNVTEKDAYAVLDLFQKLHIDPMIKNFDGLGQWIVSAKSADKYKRPTNDEDRRFIILNIIRNKKEATPIHDIIKEAIPSIDVNPKKCEKLIEDLVKQDEISMIQDKVKAKWMKDVELEEISENPQQYVQKYNANWLFEQMMFNGGITDLQRELEQQLTEDKFNEFIQQLKDEQKIIIEGDRYKKL